MSVRESGFAFMTGAVSVFVIGFSYRATDNMISTTIPLLGKYVFGLGTTYGGIAITLYGLSGLFANYVVNPRMSGGTRRSVFIALTGLVAMFCFLFVASDAITTIAIALVIGFAFGIISPSMIATASLAGGQRGERLTTLFTLGLSVSLVLGPSLESYLLTVGYNYVFLAFALISAVSFAASWRIEFVSVPREMKRPTPNAMTGVYGGLLVYLVFFIPFGAFSTFLPIYAAQVFGTSLAVSYAAFIPLFAVSLVVRAFMTARPFKRLLPPISLSFAVTVFVILAMVLVPNFPLFLGIIALAGIPHGITYTLSLIMVSRSSSLSERNASISMISSYSYAFYILVPITMGYVIEFIGIRMAFLSLLIPSLVCLFLFMKRYRNTVV